jgi:hypothetical protein
VLVDGVEQAWVLAKNNFRTGIVIFFSIKYFAGKGSAVSEAVLMEVMLIKVACCKNFNVW